MNIAAMLSDVSDFHVAFARAFAPSNPPAALDWIEEGFRLSPKDSAAPGLVSLDPWQAEVIRAWDDPKIRQTIVVASSQVGKTLIGLALMSFTALHRPGPMLYLHETDQAADSFARDRIRPSIEENETSTHLLGRRSEGGQTVTRLEFDTGAIINILGAQTPANLSSRPIMSLFATEARGFPINAGKNGDALSLAVTRLKGFGSRARAFIESSPGILGKCRLSEQANLGDRRRYHLPCPHCTHAAPVSFEPEKLCHTVSYDPTDPDDAGIACIDCGCVWSEQDRLQAIRDGFFKPTKIPSDPTIASFHYSELESPRSTISSIVRRYLDARLHPERLQTFTNTVLGLPFDPEQLETRFEPGALSQRAENYDGQIMLPSPNCLVVSAGVDVQDDRLECQVLAHGPGGERWSLDYKVFPGDPNGAGVYADLTEFLTSTVYRHPLGGSLKIRATCIDSGGHATQQVYAYSADMQSKGYPIFAIKGVANAGSNSRPIIKRSASDKALLREGDPYKLLLVGVDTGKAAIFSALKNTNPGENYIHFPTKYVEAYYRGLTSERERLKIDKRGNVAREFYRFDFKIGNEALDTFVYALAAFHTITPDPDWTEIAHRLRQSQAPQKRETLAEVAVRLAKATGAQPR